MNAVGAVLLQLVKSVTPSAFLAEGSKSITEEQTRKMVDTLVEQGYMKDCGDDTVMLTFEGYAVLVTLLISLTSGEPVEVPTQPQFKAAKKSN